MKCLRQVYFLLLFLIIASTCTVSAERGENEHELSCSVDNLSVTPIGDDIVGENQYDSFGGYVSLSNSGNILAVGARYNDGNATDSGHVRVYGRRGDRWIQLGSDIDGEHAEDAAGPNTLSGDGSIIAVGATGNDDAGSNTGHVRVFQFDGIEWKQVGSDINGMEVYGRFGNGLAFSNDGRILAVGAYRSGPNYEGQVKVFQWQSDIQEWKEMGSAINGEGNDAYLREVSLSHDGKILALGEPGNNFAGTDAGRARIFQFLNDDWEQIGLDLLGENAEDQFGYSIALSADGTVLSVAARPYINNDNLGYVMTYIFRDGAWVTHGNVLLGEEPGNGFGETIALSGDGKFLVIGAPNNNNSHGDDSGRVQVFHFRDDWIQSFDTIEGQQPYQYLGDSVAISQDGFTFAIGGGGPPDGNGIVKLFQISCDSSVSTTATGPTIFKSTVRPATETPGITPTLSPTDVDVIPTSLPTSENLSTPSGTFVSKIFEEVIIEFVGAKQMSSEETPRFEVITAVWYDEFFAERSDDLGVDKMRSNIVVTNQTLTASGNKVIYDHKITYFALDGNNNKPEQYIYLPFLDRTENTEYGIVLMTNLDAFHDLVLPISVPRLTTITIILEENKSFNTALVVGSTGAVIFIVFLICLGGFFEWKRRKNAVQGNNPQPVHQSNDQQLNEQEQTRSTSMDDVHVYNPTTSQLPVDGDLLHDEGPDYKDQVRDDRVPIAAALPLNE